VGFGPTPAPLPVLETGRLRLRARTLDDLEDCLAMDREPGTLEWVDWPGGPGGPGGWPGEAAHRAFIRARTLATYPPGLGYWVIARRDAPGDFLGWVLLIPEDATGPEVEIGWRLPVAARGRGHATEAARAVLAHGLGTLRLGRVVADIRPENAPSTRLAKRIGMRATGPAPAAPHMIRYVAETAPRP
jgi:RimJ/RimL family protein N-acetyltransferase